MESGGEEAPLWTADSQALKCALCGQRFTLFRRRHHCRSCGALCCSACCPRPLHGRQEKINAARRCTVCCKQADRKDAACTYSRLQRGQDSTTWLDEVAGTGAVTSLSPVSDKQLKFWNLLLAEAATNEKALAKLKRKTLGKRLPPSVRSLTWQVLSGSKVLQTQSAGLYQEYLESKHSPDFEETLRLDLVRTFPDVPMFQSAQRDAEKSTPAMKAAFNILKAYSTRYKEFVYAQGMSFIVALLVLMMEEEQAFWLFVKMMKSYFYWGVFKEGTPVLNRCMDHLKDMIALMAPDLHAHLEKQEIPLEIVANKWFVTLFSYNFPLPFVLRVWDLFFVFGMDMLVALGVAILVNKQVSLCQVTYAQAMLIPTMIAENFETLEDEVLSMAVAFLSQMQT